MNELLPKSRTDSLRGIAIVIIVAAHIVAQNSGLINTFLGGYIQRIVESWGAVGVAIFFFLSGYGNYISISRIDKKKEYIFWMIKRVLKLLFAFMVCYILDVLCIQLLVGGQVTTQVLLDFVTLKMPGTSTWYLKVQILLYVFIVLAFMAGKRREHTIALVGLFSVIYAFAAYFFGLPDFWWKTSLCFAAGIFFASNREKIKEMIDARMGAACIIVSAILLGCYGLILKTSPYLIVIQLISYIGLAATICMAAYLIRLSVGCFQWIGKRSLEIYLIHIGLVNAVYLYTNSIIKDTFIFLLLIVLLALMAHVAICRLDELIKKR